MAIISKSDLEEKFTLRLRAFYVPSIGTTRLIPPQNLITDDGLRGGMNALGNERQDGTIDTKATAQLYILCKEHENLPKEERVYQHMVTLPYSTINNLPYIKLELPKQQNQAFEALTGALDVTQKANENLNHHQKEMLE